MRAHLASLVEDFQRAGKQTAVVEYRGVRRHATTYAELADLAGRFSTELALRGIQPGERVVLWGENSAVWIAAFFGCLLRGVLAVPLDITGSPEFAHRVIADVSPKLVVADFERREMLATTNVELMPIEDLASTLPSETLFSVDSAVTLDTPFQIVFTSGTTSEPKGIVHTHRNVLSSLGPIEQEIAKYRKYERWFHPLRFLHSLPLSHVFGQFMGLWLPAILAAEVHFDPQLEAAHLIERIRRERISVLVAVPRVLEVLKAHLLRTMPGLEAEVAAAQGISLTQRFWRFRRIHRMLGWKFWALICGGASLPAELELFWGRMGFALVQGYGMTETAALVTLNHPFHIGRGTIGKPLPGREVRLGVDGEIEVRGPMVSTATWRSGRMEQRENEWLSTGDLATQDATGELRFAGRKGDAIVTASGMNVFPADLEAALTAQPGVRGAAVIACEGPTGPEPVGIVLCEADDTTLEQVRNNANAQLADFQRMRRVLRWPEPQFPFTATGKLLRRKIKAWACAAIIGASAPHEDALITLLEGITGERARRVDNNARLAEDFGLDSLASVQLQSALEKQWQLEIDDEAFARAETLGDLRALLDARMTTIGTTNGFPEGSAKPLDTIGVISTTTDAGSDSSRDLRRASTRGAELDRTGISEKSQASQSEHRYPRWVWWFPIQIVRLAFQALVMRPLVWFLAKPKVKLPRTKPPRGPVLLVANHITAYDLPLVLYGLPGSLRRRVAAAMAGELLLDYRRGKGSDTSRFDWFMPIAYWLITVLFNVFPLPRAKGFRQSFAHAGEAMDRGYSVLIFPEGHRTGDGHLQRFRSGIGLLAEQTQATIVPVALVGLGRLKMLRRGWFRSGRITVRVGDPIPFVLGRDPEAVTQDLERIMREMLGESA